MMNLAREEGDIYGRVIYANFNQNSTALSVGTKNGYKLYSIYNMKDIHSFEPEYECVVGEEVCIVERQFLTSLLVLVKLSSPRKLIVQNFNIRTEITTKHFSNTILCLKLNRKFIVVCLEDSLHIYNILTMCLIHIITNTPPNPEGLCALTFCCNHSLLAYPGSSSSGDIEIFDIDILRGKITVPAHYSRLVALAFNDDGSKIAAASEKGTVIRVFNVSDGQILFDFRRGVKRCVTIYSLSFSAGSEYLCASSNTETVHIFKLSKDESNIDYSDETEGWMGTIGKLFTHSAKYLPTQVSEVLSQQRSFATIHLPFSGLKNVSCITEIKKEPYVLVASSDGFLYIYHLNKEGGMCTLAKQHRIDTPIHPSQKCTESSRVPSVIAEQFEKEELTNSFGKNLDLNESGVNQKLTEAKSCDNSASTRSCMNQTGRSLMLGQVDTSQELAEAKPYDQSSSASCMNLTCKSMSPSISAS